SNGLMAKRLRRELLNTYEQLGKSGLPFLDDIGKVDVKFGLSLQLLKSIEQRGMGFNSIGTFKAIVKLSWVDTILRWDPEPPFDFQKIEISPDEIWTPDIKLFNSVDLDMTLDRTTQAIVFSNGTVLWIPPAVLKVLCVSQDDVDSCHFQFGSWVYSVDEVDIHFMDDKAEVLLDFYQDSLEILENSAQRQEVVYPCCESAYVEMKYLLALRSENGNSTYSRDLAHHHHHH
uniref:Achbp n=1 Tax=Capitella teleta TaxID=283909 RepID=I6L8L2_CAPTE|nr:Chain A, CAPITELLA TELETA ACHBP [Capitella teleta]4AFG_B Chain B, CAPITELLA TELETA ACHBP [Capitella teleta]4AFG_C Chain C, CAPITELLA TELETA ACHBP [Capitella teleta]4AFG_D Chain D, CAPITELLA TELETA ACHBP [Capitella teleta]4AFG_E Chain E, CAPITELLA TELETA ACHBP [Capitella teleta]4AFH_A Chain A, ACHBP [Capitella teleta]4AFH_B Chain B, ACHBP [Capitella teleta]4AFH_C Chain C, ACHBP [Capitella teleta]4AFH_D Chain D, ACHBP [Capitella teleta]4AFH_E Chain E, ACHBP [Capitella teleta]4B5D_A Chain